MSELHIFVQEADGPVRVSLQGELDISSAERVQKQLELVEANRPQTMVIDLRELRFIDSTGLRIVLAADLRARREGRRLVLVQGPDPVHRVFRIALLDHRLEFVKSPPALGETGVD